MTAVTEPTNYTRLSEKITHRADDLANLSPYNPVVHEIMTDFQTNLHTSQDRNKFSDHHHKLHKSSRHKTSKFKHSYYKPVSNESSGSILFKSHTHTEFKIHCQFRVIFHQKHQMRCSE
jgi:hypothetical protein